MRKSSFLKDTGAIAELSSSHCLRNNRRINLFPGVFSLLKYFSKIVFLSIGGVLSATIADFRVYHISCAGLSFPNYIYIYVFIYRTASPLCSSLAASLPCRTAFLVPGHTVTDVFLRTRNAGWTWYTPPLDNIIAHILIHRFRHHCHSLLLRSLVILLPFFFFCASSSFDGLKKKRWKLHHLYSWLAEEENFYFLTESTPG